MKRPAIITVLALFLAAVLATRAPAQPAPRTGAFPTTFTEQDPRSPIGEQNRRHGIRNDALQHYTLAEESFEVYVPENYDPQKPYGIMCWTSAGNRGNLPRGWRELMDKHRLIYIGANNVGNERGIAVRFGLAMDGIHNLRKQYRIDDSRIYASGNSGGGKIASMLAVVYPETFCGAIPIVGVAYFRSIPLPDDPTKGWSASFHQPPAAVLGRAKELNRFVLITGSNDSNRDSMLGTFERGYRPDGFQFVEYAEVEGMGHTMPPPQVVDRAIESLDKPLPQLAQRMLELGEQCAKSGKVLEARSLFQGVHLHGDPRLAARAGELLDRIEISLAPSLRSRVPNAPMNLPATAPAPPLSRESEAASLLSLAESYERSRLPAQARQRAQRIVQEFPETRAAARAKAMLNRLDAP